MSPTEQWLLSLINAISHIAVQLSVACCGIPAVAALALAYAVSEMGRDMARRTAGTQEMVEAGRDVDGVTAPSAK